MPCIQVWRDSAFYASVNTDEYFLARHHLTATQDDISLYSRPTCLTKKGAFGCTFESPGLKQPG